MIDFRSDTVTMPTPAMKDAMFNAPLGDDVFGDDPTVIELERKAAILFEKEAALFCPSGTMTNQIAIKVHTNPGDQVICDELSHIYHYEGGGIAFNSGCSTKLLAGDRGRFTSEMVENAINPDDQHFPVSRLVSLENSCNKGGGSIWSMSQMSSIGKICGKYNLKFHLDGARLFNAVVKSDYTPAQLGPMFDTISLCLSKGLGCPVGSLLIGEADTIKQARRVRKVLGGGMRQAGMLAAAGIYALDHNIQRLNQDHLLARNLAGLLQSQSWVDSVNDVETNIVVVDVQSKISVQKIIDFLRKRDILVVAFGVGKIRFVTHMDVNENDLNHCASIFDQINRL